MTAESSTQKRLGTALFYGIVVLLAYLVFLVFQPFLVALAWAAVLVVVFYPAYSRLASRWGPTLAAIVCTIGVTLILIIPTLLVAGAFIRQGVEAVQVVERQIQSGHFHDVDELIEKALDALDVQAATAPPTATGAVVLAALQARPYPDIDLTPPRVSLADVRDVVL